MFKVNELRELIRAVDHSSVEELIVKDDKVKIEIRKKGTQAVIQEVAAPAPVVAPVASAPVVEAAPAPVAKEEPKAEAPAAAPVADDADLHKITSPMVGTFYSSPSPDAAAYVQKGDKVKEDTVVCIVEAMKLMNELEAEVDGEIVEVLAENGQLVEYGQPLFLVKK